MRSRQATRVAAVLALAAMSTLVGCGQMATRPTVQKGTEGTTSQGVIQSLLTDGGPGPAPATAQLITTTEDILGTVGGVVTAGKFSTVIPPLAFVGTASVTVTVPYPNSTTCELSITPGDKNNFLTPVTLVYDMSAYPPELVSKCSLQWWDPVQQRWLRVAGSTVDLNKMTVSAPLAHFSTYQVAVEGRASW